MRKYYIVTDADEAQQHENFFYSTLVTEDGINFKPPFLPGTHDYLILVPHPTDPYVAIYITDLMRDLADENPQVEQMIHPSYTETELNRQGWEFMTDPGV